MRVQGEPERVAPGVNEGLCCCGCPTCAASPECLVGKPRVPGTRHQCVVREPTGEQLGELWWVVSVADVDRLVVHQVVSELDEDRHALSRFVTHVERIARGEL